MEHRSSLDKMPRALGLLQRLDLILKMLVLSFQVLNVTAVAAVFSPHEGNVFTRLFDDLSPPLSLQGVMMSSLVLAASSSSRTSKAFLIRVDVKIAVIIAHLCFSCRSESSNKS